MQQRKTLSRHLGWPVILALFAALFTATAGVQTFTTDSIRITKQVPDKVVVGETYQVVLEVQALNDIDNVTITDQLPGGTTYVRSAPSASTNGNRLSWTLDSVSKGTTKHFQVWATAQQEGTFEHCSVLVSSETACASTVVGKPVLALTKTGPNEALINSQVRYRMVVKNTGTAMARNVVVTDQIPGGLTHESGQKSVKYEVGNLPAGASRNLGLQLTAAQPGRHCNQATANADNADPVSAQACTVVLQPGVQITKQGVPRQILGRTAKYEIVVRNTGDTTLTNLIIVDNAPSGTVISSAPGAQVSNNTATWRVEELASGRQTSKTVVLKGTQPGKHCNEAVVRANGLQDNAQVCTDWFGQAALLLEVVDTNDPLQPGENTTYQIRVRNQGNAAEQNIKIVAQFTNLITPQSAEGTTKGTVEGQKVSFAPVASLAPKQEAVWRIQAVAKQAGDHRLKVNLTSALLKTPVTEEESTHIY